MKLILKGGSGSGFFGHSGRAGEVGGSSSGGGPEYEIGHYRDASGQLIQTNRRVGPNPDYTKAQATVKQILGNTKKLKLDVLEELPVEDLQKLANAYLVMAKTAVTAVERMSHSQTYRAVEITLRNAEASPNRRVTGFRGAHKYDSILKGGAGSGNFGHVGRPGERGGSGLPADISPATHEHLRKLGFTPVQTTSDGKTGKQYTMYTHEEGTAVLVGPGRMSVGRVGPNTATGGLMMRGTTEHAPIGKLGEYDPNFIEKHLPTYQYTQDNYKFLSLLGVGDRVAHAHKYDPDQFREPNGRWADETEDRFNQPPEHAKVKSATGIGMLWF